MIPAQLHNRELRFVKIRKDDKRPFENDWQKSKNYKWNDESLINHVLTGGNYGVIGGYGNLIILDFDSIEAYDKVRRFLPKTFTVITANKKLPHVYYYALKIAGCEQQNPASLKFLNDKKETLIDVQGEGKQVVGPGSRIKENEYKVWLDLPIATVDYNHLKRLLREIFKPMDSILPPRNQMPVLRKSWAASEDIFDKVSIPQILNRLGVKITSDTHSNCPMHPSVSEKCLHYDDRRWYCFHCEQGGYGQNLIMKTKNCSYKEAVEWVKKEFKL